MPIHNLGYRPWDGERESGSTRWMVVAGVSIRRAWQSTWLKRILFIAWAPALVYGGLIFAYEQALTADGVISVRDLARFLELLLPAEVAPAVMSVLYGVDSQSSHELMVTARPIFWKAVALQLQRSQSIAMIVVVGLVAPSAISQDVRSRAFLLYFSRPLTRMQYIAGKAAGVLLFLSIVCTLPLVLLYLVGVLLSPDITVVAYTWDIPIRVIVASATMIIPTTLLALMLSSMTTESRFATFGWFALWIFGFVAWRVMVGAAGTTADQILHLGFLFLLFSDLSTVILGIPTLSPHTNMQFAFVFCLVVVCIAVIFHRVSAPLRA